MEQSNKIQKSEVWKQIYNVVSKIPRKEVDGDAADAPSVATELEELFLKLLPIHIVSGSAWEQKLIGRNINSVFTWCKDCGMKGCNIPFEDECGNCGSKNTVRYYDKETIDLLF